MSDRETAYLMILSRLSNCTTCQRFRLYERFGSGEAVFARRREAENFLGKPFRIGGSPLREEETLHRMEEELRLCGREGIVPLTIAGEAYPEQLRSIDDPPLVLFARGNLGLLERPRSFAVVGTRHPSNFSINRAYSIARDLAEEGFVIVSGLALGIDAYAHRGAIDAGGDTIAVLGSGVDVAYPRFNGDLYRLICDRGLVVSEFPLSSRPMKHHFPMRNRIISGLAQGTLIVQAAARSGALITADCALNQGRDVMALPGRAGSPEFEGNNGLIKQGAHLVEDGADIMALYGIEREKIAQKTKSLPFSGLECHILNVIGDERVSFEDIEKNLVTDTTLSQVTSALSLLELRGAITQHPGNYYERVQDYEQG
jgi:DNA processing protein